ncbi:MAG: hypothetical protein DME59_16110 [Verrucomicrobia bacterium]|nr:MAG: hypothetical protein DME59_16110 [Verrucomicrobiota bacterium]
MDRRLVHPKQHIVLGNCAHGNNAVFVPGDGKEQRYWHAVGVGERRYFLVRSHQRWLCHQDWY